MRVCACTHTQPRPWLVVCWFACCALNNYSERGMKKPLLLLHAHAPNTTTFASVSIKLEKMHNFYKYVCVCLCECVFVSFAVKYNARVYCIYIKYLTNNFRLSLSLSSRALASIEKMCFVAPFTRRFVDFSNDALVCVCLFVLFF